MFGNTQGCTALKVESKTPEETITIIVVQKTTRRAGIRWSFVLADPAMLGHSK
jgi:hypothetical protein